MGNSEGTPAPAGLAAGPGQGEWTVRRDADIRAVLADPRFTVAPPGPGGPPGTVAWLRASVSRFATGAQHARRRALAESELRRLDPDALRTIARELAGAQLAGRGRGRPGRPAGVLSALARLVPPAALATALGAPGPMRVSAAVSTVAAAYFPGAGLRQEQRADRATAWLLTALRPAGPADAAGVDLAVARITLLVQACEATAALIGAALDLLAEAPAGAGGPTQALLAEALRRRPPVRAIRRVAGERVAAEPAGGGDVQPGDRVTCDVEAAARDPAAAGGAAAASLAFGAGIRPCPGPAHALALAAGVIDAVRERGVS
jgi:cytochrome P450